MGARGLMHPVTGGRWMGQLIESGDLSDDFVRTMQASGAFQVSTLSCVLDTWPGLFDPSRLEDATVQLTVPAAELRRRTTPTRLASSPTGSWGWWAPWLPHAIRRWVGRNLWTSENLRAGLRYSQRNLAQAALARAFPSTSAPTRRRRGPTPSTTSTAPRRFVRSSCSARPGSPAWKQSASGDAERREDARPRPRGRHGGSGQSAPTSWSFAAIRSRISGRSARSFGPCATAWLGLRKSGCDSDVRVKGDSSCPSRRQSRSRFAEGALMSIAWLHRSAPSPACRRWKRAWRVPRLCSDRGRGSSGSSRS